jgi:hypothetical protein
MRDDAVRLKAVQILNEAGVKGHDEIGELKAITKWVQNNAVYRKDPFGVEFFFTARRQIRDIEKGIHSGDCDDFVILGGALLGSLGYPVGALIVDSNNDGTFNHVMLVTKTFSPTRQFKNDWIPIELIYPQFRLGESVPISKVYPLMAHVDNIRAPVTSKIISGIKGLMGAHPIGQIAGIGNVEQSRQEGREGIAQDELMRPSFDPRQNAAPRGEQGQVGPRGDQGPDGQQGARGNQGQQGPTGQRGPQGGRTGRRGPTGQTGQRGQRGQTGRRGPGVGRRGPTGPRGPSGSTGVLTSAQSEELQNFLEHWDITSSGHLIPGSDQAYDVGNSNRKVRNMYLSDN